MGGGTPRFRANDAARTTNDRLSPQLVALLRLCPVEPEGASPRRRTTARGLDAHEPSGVGLLPWGMVGLTRSSEPVSGPRPRRRTPRKQATPARRPQRHATHPGTAPTTAHNPPRHRHGAPTAAQNPPRRLRPRQRAASTPAPHLPAPEQLPTPPPARPRPRPRPPESPSPPTGEDGLQAGTDSPAPAGRPRVSPVQVSRCASSGACRRGGRRRTRTRRTGRLGGRHGGRRGGHRRCGGRPTGGRRGGHG